MYPILFSNISSYIDNGEKLDRVALIFGIIVVVIAVITLIITKPKREIELETDDTPVDAIIDDMEVDYK